MGMTAPTVRLIYSLALEGYGTNRIGEVLYKRKIPKPSYYKQEFFPQHNAGGEDYWYDWKQESITRILRNPVYKGGMYVHETVVTKEMWQTANDIIDRHTNVKLCTSGYENIFRGLLKCPDCGRTLLIYTDNRNPDRDLLGKIYYQCSAYRKKGQISVPRTASAQGILKTLSRRRLIDLKRGMLSLTRCIFGCMRIIPAGSCRKRNSP